MHKDFIISTAINGGFIVHEHDPYLSGMNDRRALTRPVFAGSLSECLSFLSDALLGSHNVISGASQ